MNKIVQSGPAQDRTRAMSGPLSKSMASLATYRTYQLKRYAFRGGHDDS